MFTKKGKGGGKKGKAPKFPMKRPAMGKGKSGNPLAGFRKKFAAGSHEEKANTMEDLLDGESI